MALDRRRVLAVSEPRLELGAPTIEDLLRLVVEPDVRDLSIIGDSAEGLGIKAGEILEDVVRPIFGLEVGLAVNRGIISEIRVYEDLEALKETVGLLGLF